MATELEQLITEQQRDDTHVQMPEKRTQGYGTLLDLVDGDGGMPITERVPRRALDLECPIHHRQDVTWSSQGQVKCRVCSRQYERDRRARLRRAKRQAEVFDPAWLATLTDEQRTQLGR